MSTRRCLTKHSPLQAGLSVFKKTSPLLLFLFVLLAMSTPGLAQGRTVTGIVKNERGENLAGVTVSVKGTKIATSANVDGLYSIQIPQGKSTLEFTGVGFKPIELSAEGKDRLDVTMTIQLVEFDNVVVVGYGRQKKTSLTASVSVVKGKDIAKTPVADISNSLTGRATGVLATQGSGEPGGDGSFITIRGIGTIGKNANPLVIVDGVPRSFTQLDPNSIESISILKDAAAVAPYGLGGANGVVLVTTKRGKSGAPILNYSGYVGWQNPTIVTKFTDAFQFATLQNAAQANKGLPAIFSADDLQKFRDGSDPDGHPNHNVFDEIMKKNALFTNHNLSITGGNETVKYYAGLGYFSQEGLWTATNFKRYNLIANIDIEATKTTKVSLSMNGRVEDRHYPAISTVGDGGIFNILFRTPPIAPLTFSNGLWGDWHGLSAYGALNYGGFRTSQGYSLLNQLSIEQQLPFIKGLSVKAVISYDYNPSQFDPSNPNNTFESLATYTRKWEVPIPYYTIEPNSNPYNFILDSALLEKPQYTVSYSQTHAFTYQGYINYSNTFGKHEVGGLVVLEARTSRFTFFETMRKNYVIDIPQLNNGGSAAGDQTNNGFSSDAKQRSLVGRINYAFDRKYLLELSGRYDGHYYFAPGKRYGFFPAASIGWRISEEGFIKDNLPWVDNLKLRASYGESGALAGGPFQYLGSYGILSGYPQAVLGGQPQTSLYETLEPNPNITWERAKKTDIGLDVVLWNGKLRFEGDYFFERRTGLLLEPNVTVPAEYGIGLAQENAGIMETHGIEFNIGTTQRLRNGIIFDIEGNFSFARNKLVQVFETDATRNNPNRTRTGRPLGTAFGYESLGYFQVADDTNKDGIIDASEYSVDQQNGDLHPGDVKYRDVNGDNKIDPEDEVVIGRPNFPEIIYGVTPRVSWKGFELSVLFQGAANRDIYLVASWPFANNASAPIENLDYWTPENPNAEFPRILPTPEQNNHLTGSSFWMRHAGYLRLKTAELGYTIPVRIARYAKMQSARVYVAAQNLVTWTKINNFDPELGQGQGFSYPQQKVVTVGLNFSF